jgi:hypothetical protein
MALKFILVLVRVRRCDTGFERHKNSCGRIESPTSKINSLISEPSVDSVFVCTRSAGEEKRTRH